MGNTSKLAVLGGGNDLEAFGQVNNLVEVAHDNYMYRRKISDTYQIKWHAEDAQKGSERTIHRVSNSLEEPIAVATNLLDGQLGLSVLTGLAWCHTAWVGTMGWHSIVSSS